ncbi:MAG TPA: DUF4258 domain-containing protein [Chryseolinea sp.]|uniref:DUF4258 domain-containing protein n=1 Tax=Candidatus Yonathbacteria bacterium RIFCSPHIGHO2_02_FULL_44_14 TaxID=1802724 RepID=A0A1G2S5R6_9BACT|nr:MAG: hypothetical protein A3F04_01685 [Candidatus Chisholmbacteria bacterium RIFCSPHIGHO2_12_FULL_49_9]OHA80124.1 MAG: hypothetical protein A2747_00605 [Candidatus Yonathbacteria bacterium RIFCSPHIGHO2_01_FULL_44_41]OHA80464.1 MAG: hypothetical protein A3D51_01040 [Candidatus Yonathbacteria bacterium RIFCSPHIGHO2_02_FULL_44_14]OHA81912.1 MAG: hypothetical protein A3B06_04085 [Candidatus Yonathbacteria bacterium RIFCSPLOWO2_01_FULL_43_20]HKZ37574.1 DUF4258 domain-containing protein [Chryseoli
MKLKFTNHAQYRIEERGISIEDIKFVINNPDFSEINNGKIKCRSLIDGETLVAVYLKSRGEFVILTAYYL